MKKYSVLKIVLLISPLMVSAQNNKFKVQDIEVLAHRKGSSLVDFVQSISKLEGKDLQKKRETSLGDTLKTQVGISSTQFGPSASRPVIRGLDGDRIRILQNSLGSLDASSQSVDHAIAVDTLTLESIEVVRGPMSLLYGSSAVGGVINLVTKRIHKNYSEGFSSKFLTQYESVNPGMTNAVSADFGKNKFVFHIDGSSRKLEDVRTPVMTLKNSFNQQDSFSTGITKFFDKGRVGVSYNKFNTFYGTVAEEDVKIKMNQERFELHGDYDLDSSLFSKIKVKHAQSSYIHNEIENGAVATEFENNGYESRIEFLNNKKDFHGISGFQVQNSIFSATGEEAFLPTSNSTKLAAFTFQEKHIGIDLINMGARVESSKVKKDSSVNFGESAQKDFTLYNGSIGYSHLISSNTTLGTSLSYTERNANFQELFANGAHIATATFERGNSELDKEKAYALEINLKKVQEYFTHSFSVYTQQFENYISLAPTGLTDGDSGLAIYDYISTNASFYGLDYESNYKLGKLNKSYFSLTSKFDYVRGVDKKNNNNLPRISPARLSLALEMIKGSVISDLEVQYYGHQAQVDPGESSTDSYSMVNFGISKDIFIKNSGINIFGRVKNLFDIEARNHVSIIKRIAPLPGRSLVLGLQAQY